MDPERREIAIRQSQVGELAIQINEQAKADNFCHFLSTNRIEISRNNSARIDWPGE
jgi:hypothetical protein